MGHAVLDNIVWMGACRRKGKCGSVIFFEAIFLLVLRTAENGWTLCMNRVL
jgi:hypothetical protein